MGFLRGFLRVYSWIFEAILCLMAIAVSTVTLVAGIRGLELGWLPWTGRALLTWLALLGLLGLFLVLLAIGNRLRLLLFLFSVAVFILLARGFFGGYAFAGPDQARRAVILVAGALLAAIGAWPGASAGAARRSF